MFRGKRILINPVDDYCNLKGEFIMAKVTMLGTAHEKAGNVEYKMPKAMADAILKDRKDGDKKLRPQEYLVKFVNEQFGLLYNCTKVIIY